jgi:hypothetical protein
MFAPLTSSSRGRVANAANGTGSVRRGDVDDDPTGLGEGGGKRGRNTTVSDSTIEDILGQMCTAMNKLTTTEESKEGACPATRTSSIRYIHMTSDVHQY